MVGPTLKKTRHGCGIQQKNDPDYCAPPQYKLPLLQVGYWRKKRFDPNPPPRWGQVMNTSATSKYLPWHYYNVYTVSEDQMYPEQYY